MNTCPYCGKANQPGEQFCSDCAVDMVVEDGYARAQKSSTVFVRTVNILFFIVISAFLVWLLALLSSSN